MAVIDVAPDERGPAAVDAASHRELTGRAELPYLVFGEAFIIAALLLTFDAIRVPTIGWLALAAVGFGVALIAPAGAVSRAYVNVPLGLFLVWCVMSVVWTVDEGQWRFEILRIVPLVAATVLVASVLPTGRVVRSVKEALIGGLLLTVTSFIVSPATTLVHVPPDGGENQPGWHGTFGHKNAMMAFAVLAAITFMTLEDRRWLRNSVFVTVAVLAVGSQSSTGMTSLIVVTIARLWVNAYRRQSGRLTAPFVALSAFAGAALVFALNLLLPSIVNLYGKDLTFSGRTRIWEAAFDAIGDRPLLGYGLGGVWFNDRLEPTATILRAVGFRAFHGHNTAVELLLQLGVIGLVLFLTWYGSVVLAALRSLRAVPAIATWVLLFCVTQLVMGLSEVTVFHSWMVTAVLLRAVLAREVSGARDGSVGGRRLLTPH